MVTGLLLMVAVLAFAGLAYEQVPMSTTKSSTEILESYSPYVANDILTYTTESWASTPYSTYTWSAYGCYYIGFGPCFSVVIPQYYNANVTLQSTYETQTTAIIPYSQIVMESSTSLVPASAALGLTEGSFTALAVVVIGVLALLTAWVTLKPKDTHRPKQAR
jgi:hypothetical protein